MTCTLVAAWSSVLPFSVPPTDPTTTTTAVAGTMYPPSLGAEQAHAALATGVPLILFVLTVGVVWALLR